MDRISPVRGVYWVCIIGWKPYESALPCLLVRFSYSGSRSTWNRHISSEKHMTRLNAYNKFMGFELVDAKNEKHPYGSAESKSLDDTLKLIPALPVEPFVVLPGLPESLFPPSEVFPFIFLQSLLWLQYLLHIL